MLHLNKSGQHLTRWSSAFIGDFEQVFAAWLRHSFHSKMHLS